MSDTIGLAQAIVYLGSPAFLQAAFSLAAEQWGWFQKQSSKTKSIMFFAAAVIFPMASWLLQAYVPAETIASMDPQFRMLVQSIQVAWVWIVGEGVHSRVGKMKG